MINAIKHLYQQGKIRPLDYQFARFIHELDDTPCVVMVAALISHELGRGNLCLEFSHLFHKPLFELSLANSNALRALADIDSQSEDKLISLLLSSSVISKGETNTPLILDAKRLYLYRYWQHECLVARHLLKEVKQSEDFQETRTILDRLFQRNYSTLLENRPDTSDSKALREYLIKWLDVEFPEAIDWQECIQTLLSARETADLKVFDQTIPQHYCLNWQKVVAAMAATQPLVIISGGPGTGKTTTVTRLLAMLVEKGLKSDKIPDIRLVAPTGKASARLTESMGGALPALHCSEEVRKLIPSQAGTIHRLLGVIPNRPEFRHNASNPLHLDVLVVDEASMVDLTLMRQLLDALPDHARIILLGDRDQLASVDAGSVLGDICSAAEGGYSQAQADTLERLTGFDLKSWTTRQMSTVKENDVTAFFSERNRAINDRFCQLQKSYRFDDRSGIGSLAKAVNQGDTRLTKKVFQQTFDDIALHPVDDSSYQQLMSLCAQGYTPYLQAINDQQDEKTVLDAFNRFRLLCALREGRWGVEGLNDGIRSALARCNLIPSEGLWYVGRPVLITRNAHDLGLYNGDIGIALPDHNGRLKVVFELPDGSLKHLLPSRLPEHQTVFAMTIHKSQGSEFPHTVMALPEQMTPILTRELVYTGITRAKARLDLFALPQILFKAIQHKTLRSSGLKDRLINH
ncbi:exodeoxyribonuclease V subunit alpha [Endozoicomonas sp. 8E]|uniref:exodeoxyribonuclease V subunit alpha n=1 Tax=Endozoicomonas sp. 8E TaxID=3035692 RepID=UPI0029393CDE|nr:exodeoxyribonuclease V subunit alpha [Endozoicomonas sp. 8E]WOG25586.1 exodeoxyribonuclease V subunit alpha [Endozoicomonas sp. 8E]